MTGGDSCVGWWVVGGLGDCLCGVSWSGWAGVAMGAACGADNGLGWWGLWLGLRWIHQYSKAPAPWLVALGLVPGLASTLARRDESLLASRYDNP